MELSILQISILWIYIGSIAIYPAARILRNRAGYLMALIIGISLILLLSVYDLAFKSPIEPYMERIPWVNIPGLLTITLTFILDGLNYAVALIILIVTFAGAIYSVTYMEGEHGVEGYFTLYGLYTGGMLGTVLSGDLILFLFFWEAMLIPSYLLIAIWGYGDRRRVAYKYFLYTQLGTIFLIMAFVLIGYLNRGVFAIPYLHELAFYTPTFYKYVILWFGLIGFGVKMALTPLHGWLPEAHAEAPTPISVILSGVMIEIGLYGLLRIIVPIVYPEWSGLGYSTLLLLIGVLSLYYGGLMALAQSDVKRLLAYSSISQMGYMFIGIASASSIGFSGGIFHIVGHGLMKGLLFMVAGVLIHEVGVRDMRKLGGLAYKMPITASAAVIGAMGIAGLPGLAPFISEFMIFTGTFRSLSPYRLAILILSILGTALSASYMTLFVKRVFFGQLREEFRDVSDPPLSMSLPMILLALLGIILGVYPRLVLDYLSPSLDTFSRLFSTILPLVGWAG